MTVATTTSTVTYPGNGATTIFSFPFIADSANDIVVSYTNSAGVVSVLNPVTYTLIINNPPTGNLWGIGGSVTYPITGSPVVPIVVGTFLSITRAVPYTQDVSIGNQGAFYPQVVEQGLDVLELQIQQLNTDYSYTLRTPVTDEFPPNVLPSAVLRANGILGFDANGQPIITTVPVSGGTGGTSGTPRRISTTGTATLSVLTTDSFAGVSIYQSSTPVTSIQLPTGSGPYPVFDGSGNAGTYPIVVLPPAGKTINGQTQYIMAFNYQSCTFVNDGLNVLVG
jgi:hypothetical protein